MFSDIWFFMRVLPCFMTFNFVCVFTLFSDGCDSMCFYAVFCYFDFSREVCCFWMFILHAFLHSSLFLLILNVFLRVFIMFDFICVFTLFFDAWFCTCFYVVFRCLICDRVFTVFLTCLLILCVFLRCFRLFDFYVCFYDVLWWSI